MTDRPILFSGPMVRALLAGTKTQTRRIIKPQPVFPHGLNGDGDDLHATLCSDGIWRVFESNAQPSNASEPLIVRFAKGDRLYVREHWRTESRAYDDLKPADMDADYPVVYEADADWSTNKTVGRFRQGMHMPRWASRLTLTVTDVRVERLQAIGEADAIAEGLQAVTAGNGHVTYQIPGLLCGQTAVRAYRLLWETINGAGAWDKNPWVVAVSFRVAHHNIDAPPLIEHTAAAASLVAQ